MHSQHSTSDFEADALVTGSPLAELEIANNMTLSVHALFMIILYIKSASPIFHNPIPG